MSLLRKQFYQKTTSIIDLFCDLCMSCLVFECCTNNNGMFYVNSATVSFFVIYGCNWIDFVYEVPLCNYVVMTTQWVGS